jgi:hypothetical protein
MNNTKITFEVSTTDSNAKLGFEAWLNDQKVFDTDHVDQPREICVAVTDDEADHVLKLVLKNKLPEHTQLTDNGEIESDAVLKISNMAFDGIVLGHTFTEQSVYTHNVNGTAEMAQHNFYGTLGCNGDVTLKFSTPVYLWLLEHM